MARKKPVVKVVTGEPFMTEQTIEQTEDAVPGNEEQVEESVEETVVEQTTEEPQVETETQSEVETPVALTPTKSAFITNLENSLAQYTQEMAPNAIQNDESGSRLQYMLYSIFLKALKAPQGEERAALDTVLAAFHNGAQGAFSARLINRFIPNMRIADDERRRFIALIHLFTTTADPKTRKTRLKQVDFRKISEIVEDNARNIALMNYYFPQ